MTFYIKRNDTSPAIQRTLEDAAGNAVNLTGATVVFKMSGNSTGTSKVSAAATIVGDPTLGVVQYDWIAADTDSAEMFDAEWEVTYADLSVETFPNAGYEMIVITEDL